MRKSPVVRALVIPRLSYGISSKALGYCWGPSALFAVMIGTSFEPWFGLIPIAIGATAHAVLKWAYRKDPHMFAIYGRYALLAHSYHPHSRENLPVPFERPVGMGRGVRI